MSTSPAPHPASAAHAPAPDRLRLLNALASHPAFYLYCERFADKIARDIEEKVWDVATTDTDARVLRETRKRLTGGFSPMEIVKSLIATAQSQAEEEKTSGV